MRSAVILLLVLSSNIQRVRSKVFTFGASTRISQLSNWLNQDYPCQGDTIIFEENKKTVAYIDKSIQVSSIILPQVGSIIFSNDVVLGDKSQWQCTRRKSPENVFSQSDSAFPAFSDPANWITDDKPLLHMNMVPGPKDDVIFHDMGAFQISLDDQVTVNTLNVSKDWPMSTHSFTHFVRTMEGQYQVSLGHALAKESSEDNVSRILPIKDPIIILNRKEVGDYNPNMENKTMSLICNYVHCPSTTSNCTTTVRPLGHCCDVCGGMLTFASDQLPLNKISGLVADTVTESGLTGLVVYSIERIDEEDDDEIIPQFQIAVFQEGKYDDTVSRIFIEKLHDKLMSLNTENGMVYFSYKYDWSLLDHSYAPASKVAGLITFCIIILIAAAVYWRNADERERLRALISSNTSSPFRVLWHSGKEDDDVVQLMDPNEDLMSEEEGAVLTSFANICHEPAFLQLGSTTPTGSNISEGLTTMEMKLLE